LNNEVYSGSRTFDFGKKSAKKASDITTVEQSVPALVSRATQDAVIAKISSRHNGLRGNTPFVLAGKIRCNNILPDGMPCGMGYYGTTIRRSYRYYMCGGNVQQNARVRGHKCGMAYLPADRLEELVLNDIEQVLRDPGKAIAQAQTEYRER